MQFELGYFVVIVICVDSLGSRDRFLFQYPRRVSFDFLCGKYRSGRGLKSAVGKDRRDIPQFFLAMELYGISDMGNIRPRIKIYNRHILGMYLGVGLLADGIVGWFLAFVLD